MARDSHDIDPHQLHHDMVNARVLKALANEKRLSILRWLKNPTAHFTPQVDGDLIRDGVCGAFIAEKLDVSQPTASEHLRVLMDADLLKAKRIKQWVFYKRNEARLRAVKKLMSSL